MIKSSEEIIIYESPDGGKTVYSRKSGETVRQLQNRLTDPDWKKEQELSARWAKLKEAVFLDDPAINDYLEKIEILMELKR
jgi:hypothetical protein